MTAVGFAAHPGQHLDVRIRIDDSAVTYEILLSTDLSNMIHLNDPTDFRAIRAEERYVFVEPEKARATRAAFEEFFKETNPVTIDGVHVVPILKTLEFLPNPALAGDQDPYSFPPDARVVLEYPLKGSPRQVAMVWEIYPQDPKMAAFGLPSPGVMAELDAYDENKLIAFSPEEPEVIWHAAHQPVRQRVSPVVVSAEPDRIRVPVASVVVAIAGLCGTLLLITRRRSPRRGRAALLLVAVVVLVAGLVRDLAVYQFEAPWSPRVEIPTENAAIALFTTLHQNVYRAFDYKSESDIYDVLAQSVDGDLLDRVYNEVYQGLILRDQGGAVARVQSVDVIDADVTARGRLPEAAAPAFKVLTRWQVHGAVYHWGHVHARTNEYEAEYTIAQRGDLWKITAVELHAQRRIVQEGDDPEVPQWRPPAGES